MSFENLLEVTVIKNKLTAREREFCLSFLQTGDATASARRAGFRNPESDGERLLCDEKICTELERLSELRGRLLSAMAANRSMPMMRGGFPSPIIKATIRTNPFRSAAAPKQRMLAAV